MSQKRLRRTFLEAIHSVKDYIDQHPLEIKTIEELVLKTHSQIGINLLHQGFRQLFGARIKEYEIRKRLEAAALLLQKDELTMQEITEKCGYSSQSSFVRAFKEVHGITPGQWRNQHVPLLLQGNSRA
ncbi:MULTISPECIES: helix-turn-helix transcriptional regulator [Niastella]|uniref:Helix-turn-helix transcriptional regulator n=1 Tax=Niastella soli TaxID=2821487 RepID=A0ABS3YTV1_9BACT|nr:AraC family transcriptional regulator [Niastella soli]MBO9200997.1 helix-turn-helix transcriptional regulator [Niastella soli]